MPVSIGTVLGWTAVVAGSLLVALIWSWAEARWLRRGFETLRAALGPTGHVACSRSFPVCSLRGDLENRALLVRGELYKGRLRLILAVSAAIDRKVHLGRRSVLGDLNRLLNRGQGLGEPLSAYYWSGPGARDPTPLLLAPGARERVESLFEEHRAAWIVLGPGSVEARFVGRPRRLLRRDWATIARTTAGLAAAIEAGEGAAPPVAGPAGPAPPALGGPGVLRSRLRVVEDLPHLPRQRALGERLL